MKMIHTKSIQKQNIVTHYYWTLMMIDYEKEEAQFCVNQFL